MLLNALKFINGNLSSTPHDSQMNLVDDLYLYDKLSRGYRTR